MRGSLIPGVRIDGRNRHVGVGAAQGGEDALGGQVAGRSSSAQVGETFDVNPGGVVEALGQAGSVPGTEAETETSALERSHGFFEK